MQESWNSQEVTKAIHSGPLMVVESRQRQTRVRMQIQK